MYPIFLGSQGGAEQSRTGLNTETLSMACKLQKCLEMLASYAAQQNSAAANRPKQIQEHEENGAGLAEATEASSERLFAVMEHQ